MIVTNLISIFEQKTGNSLPQKSELINSHGSRPNSTPNEKKSWMTLKKMTLEKNINNNGPVPPPRTVSNRRPRRKTCAITLSSVSTDSGNSSPGQTSPSESSRNSESCRNSRTSSVSSADEQNKFKMKDTETVIVNENMINGMVNFGYNFQNKVRVQPLSKTVNFTSQKFVAQHVVSTKNQVHVNECTNPFSRVKISNIINHVSYVPQVQDLREEKVDLDEVEDITSESKLESMLEAAKDYIMLGKNEK